MVIQMAKTIFDLRAMLEGILPKECTCYIQPPGGKNLSYPCVLIDRNKNSIKHANDANYLNFKNYEKTNGIEFAAFTVHDSEDAVHPYEFLVTNYLIDKQIVTIQILKIKQKTL